MLLVEAKWPNNDSLENAEPQKEIHRAFRLLQHLGLALVSISTGSGGGQRISWLAKRHPHEATSDAFLTTQLGSLGVERESYHQTSRRFANSSNFEYSYCR